MNYQNFFEVFSKKVFFRLSVRSKPSLCSVFQLYQRFSLESGCKITALQQIYQILFTLFFIRKWNFPAKSLIPRYVFQHKNIAVFPHRETAIPYYLRTRALATSKQEQSFLTPDECTPFYWQASLIFEHPKELLRPFLKTSRRLR